MIRRGTVLGRCGACFIQSSRAAHLRIACSSALAALSCTSDGKAFCTACSQTEMGVFSQLSNFELLQDLLFYFDVQNFRISSACRLNVRSGEAYAAIYQSRFSRRDEVMPEAPIRVVRLPSAKKRPLCRWNQFKVILPRSASCRAGRTSACKASWWLQRWHISCVVNEKYIKKIFLRSPSEQPVRQGAGQSGGAP